MRRQVIYFGLWAAVFTSLVSANEALDLLDAEDPNIRSIYDLENAPTKAGLVEKKKAIFAPVDFSLPERWEPELKPLVNFGSKRGTQIAPRGLFEYQHHDRSLGRNTKLSRARLGVALETMYGIEITADALLSSKGDYRGWETLRIRIPLSDQLQISMGKFPPPFSTEYTLDAAKRWFPNLSPLVAQIAPASSLGALLEGRNKNLDWKMGWFSGDTNRSIPELGGRGYFFASLATSNNRGGESEKSPDAYFQRWHLDYIYNREGSRSRAISNSYEHLLAAGVRFSSGRLDFYSDLLYAHGAEQTALGLNAAGAYWLVQDAVRLVGSYNYAASSDPGGILTGFGIPDIGSDAVQPYGFPTSIAAGSMHAFYGGLNFHFYDDNLILGTGVEYRSVSDVVDADGFDTWGWNTWARFAF